MSIDSLEVQDKRSWIVTETGEELKDVILDANTPTMLPW